MMLLFFQFRLHEKSESLEKSKSESTVSDFLQKEATSNPDFRWDYSIEAILLYLLHL